MATLESARRMLSIARSAQRDYVEGGERREAGLYQAVTSGRSVTFVLQNMRNHVTGFDEWYGPVRERLKSDPVCKWFVEVRNRIEKRGDPGAMGFKVSGSLNSGSIPSGPPGTKSYFIGDNLGRSGFIVGLPDGSETRVYTTPPPTMKVETILEGAPDPRSLDELLEHYLSVAEQVLIEAEQRFGAGGNRP